MTTTKAQLESMRAHIDRLAHELDLLPMVDGWKLELTIGSKVYGNTFGLYVQTAGEGRQTAPVGNFLGWTKDEAWQSMKLVLDSLSWVKDARRAQVAS